ncbi:hypothetical protein BDV96DRAFT_694023 [Lophiotrema nucula]|uniref:Lysine-specific metallo-endopeptidase domain-containing protein n=1 Tax=Lophiotrema nucula TaxID=690887 RepID=A0A6A5YIC1_9PLEO|nr:hypothetical protein BDV96DRAFT_694023 [Lophiotrema nucula]
MLRLYMFLAILGLSCLTFASPPRPEIKKMKYWIHESCPSRFRDFDSAFKSALRIARRTWDRLNSDTDDNFHNVFNAIFKVYEEEDDYKDRLQDVKDTFQRVWSLVETKKRKEADIRVYCDNDAIYDPRIQNSNPDNRWHRKKDGRYYDPTNKMYSDGKNNLGPPSCSDTSPSAGVTYYDEGRFPWSSWHYSITLCDVLFSPKFTPEIARLNPLVIDEELKARDWNRFAIAHFSHLIAQTILHELTHATSKGIIRDTPLGYSYEWHNLMAMGRKDALTNADSHGML